MLGVSIWPYGCVLPKGDGQELVVLLSLCFWMTTGACLNLCFLFCHITVKSVLSRVIFQ